MSIKQLLAPETIATLHSDFNGEIQLIKFANTLRLEVGGLTQSGDVMVWIWSTAIKNLLPKNLSPENILILGLGGGSALFWLRRRFPKIHLTVVEIDPVMIGIAQKYFHIGKIKDLTIVNQDAVEFIKNCKLNTSAKGRSASGGDHWSLILMDCYQGFLTPTGFDEVKVLVKMKRVGEAVLLNRLYWNEHKTATDEFVAKISPYFQIKSVYTASNLIISLAFPSSRAKRGDPKDQ